MSPERKVRANANRSPESPDKQGVGYIIGIGVVLIVGGLLLALIDKRAILLSLIGLLVVDGMLVYLVSKNPVIPELRPVFRFISSPVRYILSMAVALVKLPYRLLRRIESFLPSPIKFILLCLIVFPLSISSYFIQSEALKLIILLVASALSVPAAIYFLMTVAAFFKMIQPKQPQRRQQQQSQQQGTQVDLEISIQWTRNWRLVKRNKKSKRQGGNPNRQSDRGSNRQTGEQYRRRKRK